MLNDDLGFFHARLRQEQSAAQDATCEVARKCHEALAALYRARIASLVPERERVKELT